MKRDSPLDDDFLLRFWGVRGSIACPGPDYARYGGNTSCIEVRCGPHLLILDAGTGLRELGNSLNGDAPLEADILLTHTHVDHITGIPFFAPFFDQRNRLRLWAGHLLPQRMLHEVLNKYMADPLFPVPTSIFGANVTFHDFEAGEVIAPRPDLSLRTAALNHPNGATGYRLDYNGRSVCYVTDTEHEPGKPDRNILGLIEGAQLLIYDCSYTDEEFPRYKTWGHSTWQEGARLCDAAGVERLVIFHHDPSHDDTTMDGIAAAAEAARPGTIVAKEGLVLHP